MPSKEPDTVVLQVETLPTGVTRIVLPMEGFYLPTPRWVSNTDLLAIVFVPLWLLGSLIFRVVFRLTTPPRVTIDVGADETQFVFCRKDTGEVSRYTWPSAKIIEFRPNRYSYGLWIHVAGIVQQTYATDLSKEAMERIGDELRKVLISKRKGSGGRSGSEIVEQAQSADEGQCAGPHRNTRGLDAGT